MIDPYRTPLQFLQGPTGNTTVLQPLSPEIHPILHHTGFVSLAQLSEGD